MDIVWLCWAFPAQAKERWKVKVKLGSDPPIFRPALEPNDRYQKLRFFGGGKKWGVFPKGAMFPVWKYFLIENLTKQGVCIACEKSLLVKKSEISGWFCWYFASTHSFTLDFLGDFRHVSSSVTCLSTSDLGGDFKYVLCSPLFGEDSHFDGHIFQMGWFKHQRVIGLLEHAVQFLPRNGSK